MARSFANSQSGPEMKFLMSFASKTIRKKKVRTKSYLFFLRFDLGFSPFNDTFSVLRLRGNFVLCETFFSTISATLQNLLES
jgi:hypothetical protein